MPSVSTIPENKCTLQGAWGTEEAAGCLELLAGELGLMLQADPRPASCEIDLAEVSSLDACGCQLLAVFLGQLERHGILAEATRIPPHIMEQIRLLGFDAAFGASGAPEKEYA